MGSPPRKCSESNFGDIHVSSYPPSPPEKNRVPRFLAAGRQFKGVEFFASGGPFLLKPSASGKVGPKCLPSRCRQTPVRPQPGHLSAAVGALPVSSFSLQARGGPANFSIQEPRPRKGWIKWRAVGPVIGVALAQSSQVPGPVRLESPTGRGCS